MDFGGASLVTGAAGFLGKYVVRHLAALGVRVRATARPRKDTSYFDDMGVEFVGADVKSGSVESGGRIHLVLYWRLPEARARDAHRAAAGVPPRPLAGALYRR